MKIILFFLMCLNVEAQTNSSDLKSFQLEKHFHLLDDKKAIDNAFKETLDIEEKLKDSTFNLKIKDSLKWKLKYYRNVGWRQSIPSPVKNFNELYKADGREVFTTKEILQELQVEDINSLNKDVSLFLDPRVQAKSIMVTENYLVLKILFRYLYGNQTSRESNETYYFERSYK